MTEAAATQAVREMLELDEDSEEMKVRTTRRTAASGPIPPQYEVVRMLLALADRTLLNPRIRRDLTWEAPENEARRVYARQVKKGHERFDKIKKRLQGAKVGLNDVAAIKANEDEVSLEFSKTVRECGAYFPDEKRGQGVPDAHESSCCGLPRYDIRRCLGS